MLDYVPTVEGFWQLIDGSVEQMLSAYRNTINLIKSFKKITERNISQNQALSW